MLSLSLKSLHLILTSTQWQRWGTQMLPSCKGKNFGRWRGPGPLFLYYPPCRWPTVPLQASESQKRCDNLRPPPKGWFGRRKDESGRGKTMTRPRKRSCGHESRGRVKSETWLQLLLATQKVSKKSQAPSRRWDQKSSEIKCSSCLQDLFLGTTILPSAVTVLAPERSGRLAATSPLWCARGPEEGLDAGASLRSYCLMN